MPKPTLSSPCPMAISRLKNGKGGFDCSSCGKSVIDFRGQSEEELKRNYTEGTCGIFDEVQLQPVKMSSWKWRWFKALTVASLIGFNVQPIQANPTPSNIEMFSKGGNKEKKKKKKDNNESKTNNDKVKKKRKKGWWNPFKKKQKFQPVGCPSF